MIFISLVLAQDSLAKDNEIRIGACVGYTDCHIGLQIEYGRPEFTVGVHSVLFVSGIFAHYNFTKTGEEVFRPILGIRGESHAAIITGGTTLDDITPYLGGEAHFRYVTLRATVGPSFDILLGYQDIGATLAVLGNISL